MTYRYAPPDGAPVVLHADDALLVVVKVEGLLSVPGKGPEKADCLIARLQAAYPRVLLIHRLDTDTSGVMVFARTAAAQADLSMQLEKRTTEKHYVARVSGVVAGDSGTVDLPLGVDWPNRPRQHVDHDKGRAAVTDWQVIARGADETRMHLVPHTGRTHQLRVHMAEIGHPILGDPLYAPPAGHPRLMLHAERLAFRHPVTGKAVAFVAPCSF